MPQYTYRCPSDSCGQELELTHSMGATPAIHCPDCQTRMERKLAGSGPAVHVKGRGYRIPVKKTGDPVTDREDKDLNARLDHELRQISRRRGSR